jgi:CheY-like chemotaxis protein/anti-sigma regulatory factor (Ser/Thr protein kinase)
LDLADIAGRALGSVDTGRHRIVRDLAPAWLQGDATRLEQIVVNLLGNAIKYTPEGGTIAVTVATQNGNAVLRVRDDGIGMSPELTARVFELFVQGDRALDRAAGGLGIGLTLVQRLAELHGGSAAASSPGPGQGSELVVRFPAIPAPLTAVKPAARAATSGPGRDVLVVEDNDDARLALCELLALGGHRVRSESDGVAGLATALAVPPEIALIDVGLPGIDGYEIARRIRAGEGGARHITLVALTGYGLPEDRQRAFDAGFDVHLVKPVNFAALTKLLS